jgi:endo-1,4-beta-xylanase
LILNDYNNETSSGEYTQQTLEIINRLKKDGLVDAVGLQMHLDGANPPARDDVVQTMRNYGVPVFITELDVDLSNVSGTQQERFDQQAYIYGQMLEACLESGVCKSFTMWGIGDKYSWLERDFQKYDADSTIYDNNLKPKPAYFTLLRIFANMLGAEPEYLFP